jgi:hypothetical protein
MQKSNIIPPDSYCFYVTKTEPITGIREHTSVLRTKLSLNILGPVYCGGIVTNSADTVPLRQTLLLIVGYGVIIQTPEGTLKWG